MITVEFSQEVDDIKCYELKLNDGQSLAINEDELKSLKEQLNELNI